MKKYAALICAVLLCLCVMCGCGKGNSGGNGTEPPAEPFIDDAGTDGIELYPVQEQSEIDSAQNPAEGEQWDLADLVGTWKLDRMEIEGYQFSAEEEGAHGSVSFFFLDPELNANYVWYDDFGNRTEIVDAMVVYLDMPLFDGCVNESWCVELIGDDDSVKCYAAILDRETMVMLVEHYDEGYECPAVSVQYFTWEGTGAVG